jgi:hypothetical protein
MNVSFLIRTIIVLVFFQGVLRLIGIPPIQYQLAIEVSLVVFIALFFFLVNSRSDKSFSAPGLKWFGLLTLAVLFSALINGSDPGSTIKFYRQVLWPYVFFLGILNINLSPQAIAKTNKFIVFLVILQIPAAIYKYLTYGIREGGIIGTFANQAGEMSTIFPLFIIGYLIAFYYVYSRNIWCLLLIPGFIFFAWGGGKRAFFFLLPALLILAYYLNLKSIQEININIPKLLSTVIVILFVSGGIIYTGARAAPRLNPERSSWGSFDMEFMISQVVDYETRTSTRGGTGGRVVTTANVFNQFFEWDLQRKLLGDGPDRLYMANDHRAAYGIGYGITGFVFSIISIGLIGTISLFLLYIKIGIRIYKIAKNIDDRFYKAVAFGTVLATIVFCFDFLMYSSAFLFGYMPSFLFFYTAAIVLRHYNVNHEVELSECEN